MAFRGRRRARTPPRVMAVLVLAVGSGACAVNPATGERQLSLVGENREIEMGREADGQIVESLGLYRDEALQTHVQAVGERLAAVSERPDLPWTFRVLDDPTVNAFALPGGFIYVTRGILAHMDSEAELVGVLGHEIGHVTARHSVNQMSKQQLARLGLGVGMILSEDIAAASDIARTGLQLLTLKFSRDDESEADELGVRYMRRSGYEAAELADVMRMLDRASRLDEGGGRVPGWLSTHPDPADRVEHIESLVAASESGGRVGRRAYLRRLDGLVFGADPREGFFDGALFHHPELRFRARFPQGWKHLNTKTAVQSVAPGEDALMLLTLTEGTPREALDRFGSDQGVRAVATGRERVNGLPAAEARFTAATPNGELQGRVLFVAHRGSTFRILGYAVRSRWEVYDEVVVSALTTFEPETDADVLARQPDRIRIVEVDRELSVEAFHDRYPSAVEPRVVALINQTGEAGVLAPGLAKQVVSGS